MATEATLAFGTDAQAAMRAGFGSLHFEVNAAVTRVVLSKVGFADGTVHPAWGDQVLGDGGFHRERSDLWLMLLGVLLDGINVCFSERSHCPVVFTCFYGDEGASPPEQSSAAILSKMAVDKLSNIAVLTVLIVELRAVLGKPRPNEISSFCFSNLPGR